jgi:hypothetical protein
MRNDYRLRYPVYEPLSIASKRTNMIYKMWREGSSYEAVGTQFNISKNRARTIVSTWLVRWKLRHYKLWEQRGRKGF